MGDEVSLRRDYRDAEDRLQDGEPGVSRVKIVAIRKYNSFLNMTKTKNYKLVIQHATSAEEAADVYNTYYSADDQKVWCFGYRTCV